MKVATPLPDQSTPTKAGRGYSVAGIAIAVFLIPLIVLTPWLCPQRCIYPNTIPWGNNFTEVGLQLVFSLLLLGLLSVWACTAIYTRRFELRKCPVTLTLAGLFLVGIVQLIPLPRDVLAAVAPNTVELRDRLMPGQAEELPTANPEPAPRAVLSLTPEATRTELTALLAALLLFVMVRNCLATPAAFRWISMLVLANGALIALFGLVRFFRPGGTRFLLYGVYATNHMTFGTFLNRNHFAFYMNVCLGLGLGVLLALYRESRIKEFEEIPTRRGRRFLESALELLQNPAVLAVCLALALMAASIVFCQSRGGLLALLGGAAVCLGMKLFRSRRFGGLEVGLLSIALAVGLTSWLGFDWMQARFLTTLKQGEPLKESRVTTLTQAWPLVRDFPLFGTGYGSFFSVQPLPWTSAAETKEIRDAHALNEYLEAAVEGGLLRLLLTLLLIALVFRLAYQAYCRYELRPTGGLVLGAVFAFTAVVIHSAVEFGIHMPPITVLVIIVVAILSGLSDAPSRLAHGDEAVADEASDGKQAVETAQQVLAPFVGGAVLVGLGFLLFADGWRENQLRKIDYGGSNPESLTLEQNLERVPILEAGLRLAPRNDGLHVELGRTQLRIYEQKASPRNERASTCLAADTVASLAGLATAPAPGAWALALSAVPGDLARRGQNKPDLDRLAQEHLVPSLRHYIQARNLAPLNVQSHMGIAVSVDRLARGDSFEAYLGRAKLLRPADPELWYRCGLLESKHQERDEAYASWRRCLTLNDKHLIDIVDQCFNDLSAQQLVDKVLPDDPKSLLIVARGFYGKPEQASEQQAVVQHVLALLDAKESPSAEDYRAKSYAYRLLGMEELSQAAFQDALAAEPANTDLRFEYASILFQVGRYQDCRKELARVVSMRPDHAKARELLASAMKLIDSSKETDGMVTESFVDFGTIPHGTKLTHAFRLKNTTKATLHVSNTRSSCGCAKAGVERTELPPGDSMSVVVKLDSGRFTGPKTYVYYVDFDQPTEREVRFFARANSRTELTVDPPELTLDRQQQSEGTVTVTHHGSGSWHVLGADADGGTLGTELRETSRQDKQVTYQVRVRASESTAPGNIDVWLKTDDAAMPKIRVPVRVRGGRTDLVISPDPLDLGRVAPGAIVERRVVVRCAQPFKVRSIEGADDQFQITGGASDSKPVQVLTVTFKAGEKRGAVSRRLRLATDAGAATEFTVKGDVN
jgi:O-antigen ligase/tetratricopeptide (TPR) repeat protein